jgi:hypothetical protein
MGDTTPFAWISNGTSARCAAAAVTGTGADGGRAAFFEHAPHARIAANAARVSAEERGSIIRVHR